MLNGLRTFRRQYSFAFAKHNSQNNKRLDVFLTKQAIISQQI